MKVASIFGFVVLHTSSMGVQSIVTKDGDLVDNSFTAIEQHAHKSKKDAEILTANLLHEGKFFECEIDVVEFALRMDFNVTKDENFGYSPNHLYG